MSNPRINKREREKAKREKAAAKAERRLERRNAEDDTESTPPIDQEALLAELADLHRRFEADEIPFDDFVAEKDSITERLQVG